MLDFHASCSSFLFGNVLACERHMSNEETVALYNIYILSIKAVEPQSVSSEARSTEMHLTWKIAREIVE